MSNEELTAKQRRIKEIENAALMNVATTEMIEEAQKLKKEIQEAREKSVNEQAEEMLKKWGIASDSPVGTKCDNF